MTNLLEIWHAHSGSDPKYRFGRVIKIKIDSKFRFIARFVISTGNLTSTRKFTF